MSSPSTRNTKSTLAKLEDVILQENPEVFNGLPKDRSKKIIETVAISIKSHSGPLPDPETLDRYNGIIPNGADRIMIGFEKQLEHRIKLESLAIGGQNKRSNRGQNYAFIITIFVLILSFGLIYLGHDAAGALLGSVDLVALVVVFITGKSYQKNNLEEKRSSK